MNRVSLPLLDQRVEQLCRTTNQEQPYWPCKKGCDDCCRSLPSLPIVSWAEWSRLYDHILTLPERDLILGAMTDASEIAPVVCPVLDQASGSCRAYTARPIACRTYGYYADRDAAQCCSRVLESVENHVQSNAPVVWGNGETIARDLDELGEAKSLKQWLSDSEKSSDP